MSRYIDADKLCDGRVSNDPVVIAAKCAQEEDVAPVVHAHWIYKGIWYDGVFYECSACKRGICTDDGISTVKDFPYCHCGAKMDKEVRNE